MQINRDSACAVAHHPCFSETAHFKCGRIHLPVARNCNIQCAYCDRKYDCPNESRPGVTSSIVTPDEALERVHTAVNKDNRICVAGVAGPGEPLFNPDTFETLKLIHRFFPQLFLCLSTNGLLLPEKLEDIIECGVTTITVTVNTLRIETARKLYSRILIGKQVFFDDYGISELLKAQKKGVQLASEKGIAVKINTVLVPGINDGETDEIAEAAAEWGAVKMNIIPLIPQAKLADFPSPTPEMIHLRQNSAERFIPQFTMCRQCRADACGIPGKYENSQILFKKAQG